MHSSVPLPEYGQRSAHALLQAAHACQMCHAPSLVAQDAFNVVTVVQLVIEAWWHIDLPLWVAILAGWECKERFSLFGLGQVGALRDPSARPMLAALV